VLGSLTLTLGPGLKPQAVSRFLYAATAHAVVRGRGRRR
jgi:hypothetical protein